MKIALVCCPVYSTITPPLSIATFQAFLKKKGYQVTPIDLNIKFHSSHKVLHKFLTFLFYIYKEEFTKLFYVLNLINKKIYDSYIQEILNSKADVICFTTYKPNGLTSIYLANKIKEIAPNKKIIFGGPFCFNKYIKKYLIRSKSIDTVILGEGEQMLLKELKYIKKHAKTIFLKEGKCQIKKTKKPDLININKEPLPDFGGIPLNKCKYILYSTARGCNNNCAYCIDKVFWQIYRAKSSQKIFKDLKNLKDKYKIKGFVFADSIINGDKKELERLCDLIIKNRLKIRWGGQARCEGLNKKLLKKIRKSGCVSLTYGIESGSQKVLDDMKKNIKIKEAEQIIKNTFKAGIKVIANFMVGYPTETWLDFYKTINFLYSHRKYMQSANVTPTLIFECTDLHKTAGIYNFIKKDSLFLSSKKSNFLIRFIRFMILKLMISTLFKRIK